MNIIDQQKSTTIYSEFNFPHRTSSGKTFRDNECNNIISFEACYQLKDIDFYGINSASPSDASGRLTEKQVFNIRIANSNNIREKAESLIRKKYSWRGYSFDEQLKIESNKITLIADTKGKTVGTMTLCLDSETGLPADENFYAELDVLRLQGHKISEPSKLAIEANIPKRVFAAMIHVAYIYAHKIHRCTDWVIEINPRHAMFYKRMLGFNNYGEERICTRVNAPATLLKLKLEYMAEQINRFSGLIKQNNQNNKERSFYPHFFSVWDEPTITNRLKRAYLSNHLAPYQLQEKQNVIHPGIAYMTE
nr:long-chain N-acyl amino acid synthase [Nitrosomonas nitrosa]